MVLWSFVQVLLLLLTVTANNKILVDAVAVLTARADVGCGFHLLTGAPAPVPFPVGQLDSGQCRAGSGMTPSLFTWFGDAFVDQQGRGCWWTRKTVPSPMPPTRPDPFVNGDVSSPYQPT